MSQGFLSKLAFGPRGIRWLLNAWPPFRGMGVRVREIAPDFRRARVELRMGLLNRNYVGTHFGGSMFAMTDPFHMVLMMHVLGREYIVWDKAGSIRFIKPGRGTLVAEFEVTQAMVDEVIAKTADGAKFEPTYAVDLKDGEGAVVATVEKTLYIRKKK
jgi:acyl-coenzyme A thioesterase PaaI-like protein